MTDVREEVGGRNQSEQGPLGLRGKNQGIIRWYLGIAILNAHVIVITEKMFTLGALLSERTTKGPYQEHFGSLSEVFMGCKFPPGLSALNTT